MATKSLTFELFGHDRTASSAIRGVGDAGAAWERRMAGAAFGVGAALGAATVAAVAFSIDSIKAFAEAETAQNRLNFAFDKFPSLVGGNIGALRDLNTELQKTTRFDDDAIAGAEGILAQFDLTADQLTTLVPLMLDYAAATGKDVTEAADDMGKAILGQGRALKGVGIKFEDAGDPVSNYTQLIAGLTEKVQGFAATDAQTISGTLDRINNQFGDVQEKLGQAFAPALTVAADIIQTTLIPGLDDVISRVGPELETELNNLAPNVTQAVNDAMPAIERLGRAIPGAISGLADSFSADFGPKGIFGGSNENGTLTLRQNIIDEMVRQNKDMGFDWNRTLNAMSEYWDLAWDSNADTVKNKSEEIKATWRMGIYDMNAAVLEAGTATLGWQFAQGFADGITSNSEAAATAAENMALRARDKVVNAMQIKSPSRVMRDLGAYIPQGFAMGIEDEMWRVDSAFADMAPTSKSMSVAARVPSGGGGTSVVVNVNGAVGNEDFLAKTVVRAVQNSQKRGQTPRGALV